MLTVRTSRCAAIGIVAELMDVHAALSVGIITSDIPCDSGWGGLGDLLECNGSGDLGVSSDGSNYN